MKPAAWSFRTKGVFLSLKQTACRVRHLVRSLSCQFAQRKGEGALRATGGMRLSIFELVLSELRLLCSSKHIYTHPVSAQPPHPPTPLPRRRTNMIHSAQLSGSRYAEQRKELLELVKQLRAIGFVPTMIYRSRWWCTYLS